MREASFEDLNCFGRAARCGLNKFSSLEAMIHTPHLHAGIGLVDYRNEQDWWDAERMVDYLTGMDCLVRPFVGGHPILVKGSVPSARKDALSATGSREQSEA